jgi:uncharacterized membrane protein YidH (DUF202 family)
VIGDWGVRFVAAASVVYAIEALKRWRRVPWLRRTQDRRCRAASVATAIGVGLGIAGALDPLSVLVQLVLQQGWYDLVVKRR